MNRPLIIVNNAAAKARRVWPNIKQRLDSAAVEFDWYETKRPGDATVRTREALRTGINTVAVVGGDGTLSEAAEGFFQFGEQRDELPTALSSSASLGVLPAGTGDDFARGLIGHRAPLDYWIEVFMSHCRSDGQGTTRLVDVLYGLCDSFTTPFICLNASTMGIGGETAARVAAQGKFMRKFSGEARFAAAALKGIAVWRERRVRVSIDDKEFIEGPMNLAAVANALYAGGGMMLSPEATIDDGKLDVVTASGLTRIGVLRELTRIHKGGHMANPRVRIAQGRLARVETFTPEDAMRIEVDGNVRGFTPVEFRVMPKALRFVTGQKRV